jgi:hypothetical protein
MAWSAAILLDLPAALTRLETRLRESIVLVLAVAGAVGTEPPRFCAVSPGRLYRGPGPS